ncbi:hypothetical protein GQ607_011636 [Colletotrichum asianum]|uniref:Uncharacterized protein n=1 Tax=Colletotrichum asianum TaxID=702518 RepID=A0A8H3W6M5_9PEZI|nr:hypothetical protein GQ607_011636 [Colletotrichum asianum]
MRAIDPHKIKAHIYRAIGQSSNEHGRKIKAASAN